MSENNLLELSAEALGHAPGRGRLLGKKILVVGGGQADYGNDEELHGNGRAMSILFGREGAAVTVADLDLNSARDTVKYVQNEGVESFAVVGDATKEAEVQRIVEEAHKLMGGLDGLVLNVGIDGGHKMAGTSAETWDTVFAVNARSHFLACKSALPLMNQGGSVVLISSTSAYTSTGGVPAMSASKAALEGIRNHVANENVNRGIRCNILAPGLIDTPLGRKGGRQRPERNQINIPIGRFGTSWDTAYAATFLLSGESTYITGQTIVMDGGRMLR
ncbi:MULTISPECIES: SDR family NAD(P)-dependent oxidoreductase [unclassified Glutamicibacter]|uniref:SDR family NAD(P)-dependent oxidoreductase n=1 Tax=unclassified Glutamicibacter TaxID=2627139 RepID=UPI00380EAB6F